MPTPAYDECAHRIGRKLPEAICSTPMAGLDLLSSGRCKASTICGLLEPQRIDDMLGYISPEYDHIIIDTPPVLAVPDALLWAKAVDATVLTTFSGHTESPDLQETLERLAQIDVSVLGAVLHNVPLQHSYNSYHYYTDGASNSSSAWRNSRAVNLLPMGEQEEETCVDQNNDVLKEYAFDRDA